MYATKLTSFHPSRSLVLLFLHTSICSPDEGSMTTETSHFIIKSLVIMCHAYIFLVFVLLYANTRDAYLFATIYFMYIYT